MRIRDRLTGPPTGPRAAYLCHGFCELGATPLVTMLEGVRDFLVENPGEVLVFVIEDYVTPDDVATAFRESGLERFVYRGAVAGPWPTLRELIDSDQRLVVFGENDTKGVPWYHPAFETFQETPYKFLAPVDFSCRPNRGGATSAALPGQPLDRDDAGPEADERRDRQRARLSSWPAPACARRSGGSCRTSSPSTSP